jgi:hypothetical protein
MKPGVALLIGIGSIFMSASALADGKRDLEDGIAFYENLDTDRALERLKAAAQAKDLAKTDRAKAFLYLGMVYFENGEKSDATTAWKSAFELDRNLQVPAGTSPKTIEAIELVRAEGAAEPGGVRTPPPDPNKTAPPPKTTPDITPPPPPDKQQELVTAPPPAAEDSSMTTWLIVGGVAAAAIAAGVVILLVAGGGDCTEGGCLTVSFE